MSSTTDAFSPAAAVEPFWQRIHKFFTLPLDRAVADAHRRTRRRRRDRVRALLPRGAGCPRRPGRNLRRARHRGALRLQDHRAIVPRFPAARRLSAVGRGPRQPVPAVQVRRDELRLRAGARPGGDAHGRQRVLHPAGLARAVRRGHAGGHDASRHHRQPALRAESRGTRRADPAHRQAIRGAGGVRVLRRPVPHLRHGGARGGRRAGRGSARTWPAERRRRSGSAASRCSSSCGWASGTSPTSSAR